VNEAEPPTNGAMVQSVRAPEPPPQQKNARNPSCKKSASVDHVHAADAEHVSPVATVVGGKLKPSERLCSEASRFGHT
jgi:hypothetical protein